MPLSLAILRSKALQIASPQGIFTASNGYLQNWARRYGWSNVALHGCGTSANVEEAAARMDEIRRQLRGVDQDLIFNVDETGMLYTVCHLDPKCLLRTAGASAAPKR